MDDTIEQRTSSESRADTLGLLIQAISSPTSLPEVGKEILGAALDMTSAEAAALWASDLQDGKLVLVDMQGFDDKNLQPLRSFEVWIAENSGNEKAILDYQENILRSGPQIEVVFTPLRVRSQMAGVLGTVHIHSGQGSAQQDLDTLSTIGDLAAIAIQLTHRPKLNGSIVADHHREIESLRQREEIRSDFINGIVHDLKAPISSINGYVGLIQNTTRLDDRGQAFLQAILDTTDRILNMVQHLLDMALLTNTEQIRKHPLDLESVVEETLKDVEGTASLKKIRLRTEIVGEPYLIDGDERRLARCLLNLLDNAIKYSPEDSAVFIALTYCKDSVILQVSDQGPGIDSEDLPYIFDQFYQGKRHDKSGVGLGLQLVQATVAVHDGTVTVRNLEDAGAEFTITLPAKPMD